MRNTNKKGFTIVELVVVVAVIAILAAVLIPTFSGIIAKANLSADQSAVTNMNKILATKECATISDAIILLDANGLDLEDYKPLSKDHFFYFVNGRIILADKNDSVVFPKNAKVDGQWMTLSGEVPMDDNYTVADNGSVSIDSGAKLVHLMNTVANGGLTTTEALNITLSDDIDLKGTTINFGQVTKNITLNCNGNEITGLRADTNAITGGWEGKDKAFGFSLFGIIEAGTTVEVKNVNFSNVIIRDTTNIQSGMAGVIAGQVKGTLKVENVKIDNCHVYGGDKVGVIAGYVTGNISINKVTVTNSSANGVAYVAKAIGLVGGNSTLSITDSTFDVTTSVYDAKWSDIWWDSDKNWEGNTISTSDFYTDANGNVYTKWTNNAGNKILFGTVGNGKYWQGKTEITIDGVAHQADAIHN